ncbi:MAG: heavy metal translocating P-type ATPase [Proteobacteria bacterium]|nr:MAG: heavy metal translocating P-type ATPase [Pseudomonadota bacterium]
MLELKHKSKNRLRFYFEGLDKSIDQIALKKSLEEHDRILHVRINPANSNIIIKHEDFEKEVFDLVKSLDLKSFKKPISRECFQHPTQASKTKLFYSLAALGTSFVLKNQLSLGATTSLAALPLFKEGLDELLNDGVTSKVLEASAVGVSMIRRDFMAANSTNFMLNIGEYLEESTAHKSDDLIRELAKPNVLKAWIEVVKDGKVSEKKINTNDIKVGDIVVVNTGDTIPIDGHIMSEAALINEVSMTGEAQGVSKKRGDKVISGTIVEEGRLRIWAEQVGENTATARIKKYIQSSLNEKSNLGLRANDLAQRLVPVTLGLAAFAYLINRDLESVASVLQADYSCALKLATPVAFKSAISQAGKDGILIKGAKSIEALSNVDTFVFDKTGTLTHGKLKVIGVISFCEDWSREDILNLTASAEEHYFHPVAEAVVEAAKKEGFIHIHHEEVKFIVAHGVKTRVDGKEVVIGSRHFLEEDENISFKENEKSILDLEKKGQTLLYVGYDGKLLGIISMSDNVRENAKDAIKSLKENGVKEIIMLTGDVEEKALKIAQEVGVDKIYAQLLPTQKAQKLKEFKKQGKNIAFVGDGINDAPALINAHVGISMSRGADIAKATADISLLRDDILAVARAKELANKTMKRINGNFNATVGINSAILLGATFGLFNPITTAVLHNGTTVGLLINSMQKHKLKTDFRKNRL